MVISVIMLLAALTMPVVTQALHQADRTTCRSNLRQIGGAMMIYCNSFNSCYPPTETSYRYCLSVKNRGKVSIGHLYPEYLADGRIYYCPALDGYGTVCEYDSPDYGFVKFPHDLCDMGYICSVHSANEQSLKRPQPSQQAMVADNVIRYMGGDWGCGHWCHVTGYNVLYADNSAGWYPDPDESIAWSKIHSGTTRLKQVWEAFSKRIND